MHTISGSPLELDPASLPAPDWILLYLMLSRLAEEYLASRRRDEDGVRAVFMHLTYVSYIPKTITTPLHFSPAELALLANTPLLGSTERRLRETLVDYERARQLVCGHLTGLSGDEFGVFLAQILQPVSATQMEQDPLMARTLHKALELWRWAESAFTSRSFPPRLIGLSDANPGQPSSSETSAPILIPGYDTFNHARAHPVTWSTTPADSTVCMTLNYALPHPRCQVYNNYGGKSNEEFLSGYGFTLPTCSEDTMALKLGEATSDPESTSGTTHYWRIPATDTVDEQPPIQDAEGRFVEPACPAPGLPADIRRGWAHNNNPPPMSDAEAYANIIEVLEAMMLRKRKAFRASQRTLDAVPQLQLVEGEHAAWHRAETDMVRKEVFANIAQYRHGQLRLLNHAVKWSQDVLERVADVLDGEDDFDSDDEDEQGQAEQ
ncbi:hypothetical protein EX895_006210 [Sporisorium graminicola]|uniref:SET domain-containing protein n=1 Tax=Sporisorium graminicola TaxID=280036 RepID=A0A4U7KLN3_9BASI|nr:hypothetical protein EX895_006210 [Sporisorium graminicola]TKY85130.1 hypothetical protein EX895_006210 [Sporisorium graminicola]